MKRSSLRGALSASWVVSALSIPALAHAQAGSVDVPGAGVVQAGRTGFEPNLWYLPADELLGFVEIPAGPFLMGSDLARDPSAFENEVWRGGSPPRTVEVPGYFIGRTEVTVAQFATFVRETGYSVGDPAAVAAPPDFPVASVSWTDALAYARWLERTLRVSSRTPERIARLLAEGWRITLPSEAEWEKAARGPDGRIYPWGDAPRADRARYGAQSPAPVGSYPCPECPYGLFDMSGNVWEWTRTPFQLLPYSEEEAPLDLEADALWTMRGGSYSDDERNVRVALRGGADPGARRPFIGFRLVITQNLDSRRTP